LDQVAAAPPCEIEERSVPRNHDVRLGSSLWASFEHVPEVGVVGNREHHHGWRSPPVERLALTVGARRIP
jgi:hypothetical protein